MYRIVLITGQEICFEGKYRKDLETRNWHYYETPYGMIHFRKDHMAMVIESKTPQFYSIKGLHT